MSRAAITTPIKGYSGVSGTVHVPKGCVLLYLTATGNGTIQGFPDGQGGSLTITIPNTSQWFLYDSPSMQMVLNPGPSSSVWDIVFTGTTAYYFEVTNPAGGF